MVRTTPSISTFSGSNETPGRQRVLHDPLPQFAYYEGCTLGRWRTRTEGLGDDRGVRACGIRAHRNQRRPYKLTPAVSLVVSCETQDEIDHYRDTLLADGGKPSMCGWLEDRFGLSWQVVPSVIGELLTDADPSKAARAGRALMSMQKLDLAALQRAS